MNGPASILRLPPELLEIIVSMVRYSVGTLKALSQSCHYLHAIVAPFLYHLVVIWSPKSMKYFLETAARSHYLTSLIRELQIHYHDLDEETDNSPEYVEPILPRFVNLESLIIRSNDSNWGKPSKLQLLRHPQETLPTLRSITLSVDYDSEWKFPVWSYRSLLHHPGLEKITITGAEFELRWRDESPTYFRSSRLRELNLLNCDVTPEDIQGMLHSHHQLKHFTLKGQEAMEPIHWRVGEDSRQWYVDALRSQSSSLESLDLDIQYMEWEEPMDLSNFSALQSLTTSPRMLIGDNYCFWLKPASALEWAKLLPSNLQHIKFRSSCGVFPISQIYQALREGYLHLRSLTCQIASNMLEDGSLYYEEADLNIVDPEGIPVFRSPDEIMSDVSPDGVPYSQGFWELGTEFIVTEVPRIEKLPGYDSCPCTCWIYKHRVSNVPPAW